MHEDLVGLNDRTWGWGDDYRHLSAAAREAIRAHPGTYAWNVAKDFGILLRAPILLDVPSSGNPDGAGGDQETIVVNGRRLPKPTEGDLIPSAHQSGLVSTPDVRIRQVWRSPSEHHLEYRDPADARRAARVEARMRELGDAFSDRGTVAWLASALNDASRVYPRVILLLLVGVVAVAIRRPRGWPIPAVLVAVSLLVGAVTVLGVYAVPEYMAPLAPAFVLLAAVGLFAPRSESV
jgi:hypothetical protein